MARAVVGGDGYSGGGGLDHGGGLSSGFGNRRSGEHSRDCVAHTVAGSIRTTLMWATGKSLGPPNDVPRESPRTTRL
jgi:hypothetical protein